MRPTELDIWILAGQSNMQGCGLLHGALEPDERVYSFTSAGNWEVACEPLHRLWESYTPVHSELMRTGMSEEDKAKGDSHFAAIEAAGRVTGSGLGIAFGKALATANGRPVGLVPAAHGGTSLSQWDFATRDQGGRSLYGAMLDRTRRALEGGGTLRGVLWYQGESDATDGAAEAYRDRYAAWIEALRSDLGAPNLPVLNVQISNVFIPPAEEALGQGWRSAPWENIREALRQIPHQVPHTATVAAIDLGLVDSIHIDTPGLVRLGQRLARVAQGAPAPDVTRIEAFSHRHGMQGARVVCSGVSGSWNPRHHIGGFAVRTAESLLHPTHFVITADADPANPSDISLLLNAPIDDSVRIGYGLGLAPYCNATDDADMPLPAFAAMPVQPATATG